ncbi:MAG: iron-containing redox enzyme family protein [Bdellovibrionaceae bacterium]|nr:iron-containing redox enzyme family protein [Pseudobdellovibrionaceae bacterium]
MKQVNEAVEAARALLRSALENGEKDGGLTKERYVRFLTMQYHLTKGVQRHFLFIAGHPATAKRRELRKWLINFAQEEEFHFEIAKTDLKELGTEPGPIPFDTKLWWLYFNDIIADRPFVRLGATCILENISDGSADVLDRMIQTSGFLTPKSLKFLTIHRHGPNLDHGDQVLHAIEGAKLNDEEMADILEGTRLATVFYMRFIGWILTGKEVR